jgi:hypothetical protein
LRRAIAAAAAPPAASAESRSTLERAISGQTYVVEENSLGLRRFSITFEPGRDAVARLELLDQTLLLPVGLDGRFRISDQAIDGIRPGARGTWRTSSRFVLEVDLIGKIDDYTLDITYEGDNVRVELSERTGLMRQTLHGRLMTR